MKSKGWADMPAVMKTKLDASADLPTARQLAHSLLSLGLPDPDTKQVNLWLKRWCNWLTREEQTRLFAAINSQYKLTILRRDRIIAYLLLRSGVQVTEVGQLNGEDYRDGWLQVNGRRIPFSHDINQKWLEYAKDLIGPVFLTTHGKPLSYSSIVKTFSTYFQEAGLEHVTLNALPNTFEHELINRGVNPLIVAALTGTDLSIPWEQHFTPEQLQAAVDSVSIEIKASYREEPFYLDMPGDIKDLFWKAFPEYLLIGVARQHNQITQDALFQSLKFNPYYGVIHDITGVNISLEDYAQKLQGISLTLINIMTQNPETAKFVLGHELIAGAPDRILDIALVMATQKWQKHHNITDIAQKALATFKRI